YINTITEKYATDFAADDAKWDYIGHKDLYWIEFDKSEAGNCKNQEEAAICLYNWLDNRIKSLDEIFNSDEFLG
nr:hypothetical protein [bacterium]